MAVSLSTLNKVIDEEKRPDAAITVADIDRVTRRILHSKDPMTHLAFLPDLVERAQLSPEDTSRLSEKLHEIFHDVLRQFPALSDQDWYRDLYAHLHRDLEKTNNDLPTRLRSLLTLHEAQKQLRESSPGGVTRENLGIAAWEEKHPHQYPAFRLGLEQLDQLLQSNALSLEVKEIFSICRNMLCTVLCHEGQHPQQEEALRRVEDMSESLRKTTRILLADMQAAREKGAPRRTMEYYEEAPNMGRDSLQDPYTTRERYTATVIDAPPPSTMETNLRALEKILSSTGFFFFTVCVQSTPLEKFEPMLQQLREHRT